MKTSCERAQPFIRDASRDRMRTLLRHVRAASNHDVDGIHDLRVASRRLRAVLSDYAEYFEKKCQKAFRKDVKSITRGLGPARELDVTLNLLREWQQRLPDTLQPVVCTVDQVLRLQRDAEGKAVDASCEVASSPRFVSDYEALIESIRPGKRCIVDHATVTMRKRFKTLSKAITKWQNEPSDDRLHAVRIAFKKLRYSCEILQPLYGEPMGKFIGELKSVQEALGAWNDQRILRDHVADVAQRTKDSAAIKEFIALIDRENASLYEAFIRTAGAWIDRANRKKLFENVKSSHMKCCTETIRS